jgi:hypothetical protein
MSAFDFSPVGGFTYQGTPISFADMKIKMDALHSDIAEAQAKGDKSTVASKEEELQTAMDAYQKFIQTKQAGGQ